MVHLRIADILLKEPGELDETAFVMGNIAPDSGVPNEDWSRFTPPKAISHFKTKPDDEFFFDIDKFNCSAEISYCLKSGSWGQGIMTEALDAMLKFGFEDYGFNRIVAKVMKGNAGSIKVLQKLGFVQEGILRESLYKNGQYHDLIVFSILKSEYHT